MEYWVDLTQRCLDGARTENIRWISTETLGNGKHGIPSVGEDIVPSAGEDVVPRNG